LASNLTKTKYLPIGKPAHKSSPEGNNNIKCCEKYKHLRMKINEGGRYDSGIKHRIDLGRHAFRR
jgi:hypothetical protein